jgi:hypothetical protein
MKLKISFIWKDENVMKLLNYIKKVDLEVNLELYRIYIYKCN